MQNKEFYIGESDILERISKDETTRVKAFLHDATAFDKEANAAALLDGPNSTSHVDDFFDKFFPCTLWTKSGLQILPGKWTEATSTTGAVTTRAPGFIATINVLLDRFAPRSVVVSWNANNVPYPNALRAAAEEYASAWEQLLTSAAVYSGLFNRRPTTGFDVNARFFTVPNELRPFRLYITPRTLLRIDDMVKICRIAAGILKKQDEAETTVVTWSEYAAGKGAVTHGANVKPPQCRFIVAAEDDLKHTPGDFINISTHPLGLYSTFVHKSDLNSLIDAQDNVPTNQGTWKRPLPTSLDQVRAQNDALLSKLRGKFRMKKSQVSGATTTETIIEPTTAIDAGARQLTQSIMGNSANKVREHISFMEM